MKAIEKELIKIEKVENRMCQQALKRTSPIWKSKIEEKVPNKVLENLKMAFSKAFYLIFEKGALIIEKTYDKASIAKDFQIKDFAVDIKGGRKEIGNLKWDAATGNAISTLITTSEGIGLGALGIGMPDIVIWVGVLLRGVYETALKYGFDYERPEEKLFILEMLETAMLNGDAWVNVNASIDTYISQNAHVIPDDAAIKQQIEKTSNAFATDMLITKFIQGIPIVGIVGGATNPFYYNKVMSYVQLKYRKRYLLGKMNVLI